MSILEERIAKAVEDKLSDGVVEKLVADAVEKALKESISEQFRYSGEAKKAINEKVKEVMAPAIEKVDLNDYVAKLDTVLTGIVNSTSLIDNKEILENFKELMTEPDKKMISLEDIFDEYVKYVSENIDTSDLEIDYDDRPTYQNVTASVETEEHGAGHYCDLIFNCEEDEKLKKVIHLYKNSHGSYSIFRLQDEVNLNSLRYTDSFDIFVMKLDRAFCKITDIKYIEDDEIEVEAKPEASWS